MIRQYKFRTIVSEVSPLTNIPLRVVTSAVFFFKRSSPKLPEQTLPLVTIYTEKVVLISLTYPNSVGMTSSVVTGA